MIIELFALLQGINQSSILDGSSFYAQYRVGMYFVLYTENF